MPPRKRKMSIVKEENLSADAPEQDVRPTAAMPVGRKKGKPSPSPKQMDGASVSAIGELQETLQRLFPKGDVLFAAAGVEMAMKLPTTSPLDGQDLAISEFIKKTVIPRLQDFCDIYGAPSACLADYEQRELELVAIVKNCACASPPEGWFCPPALQNHMDSVMGLLRWYNDKRVMFYFSGTEGIRESSDALDVLSKEHGNRAESAVKKHMAAADHLKTARNMDIYEDCGPSEFLSSLQQEEYRLRGAGLAILLAKRTVVEFCEWYRFAAKGLSSVADSKVGTHQPVLSDMSAKVNALYSKISPQLSMAQKNSKHLADVATKMHGKMIRKGLELRNLGCASEAEVKEGKATTFADRLSVATLELEEVAKVRVEVEYIHAAFERLRCGGEQRDMESDTFPTASDETIPFDSTRWAADLFPSIQLPSYVNCCE